MISLTVLNIYSTKSNTKISCSTGIICGVARVNTYTKNIFSRTIKL